MKKVFFQIQAKKLRPELRSTGQLKSGRAREQKSKFRAGLRKAKCEYKDSPGPKIKSS
jgi:hypothetical protein